MHGELHLLVVCSLVLLAQVARLLLQCYTIVLQSSGHERAAQESKESARRAGPACEMHSTLPQRAVPNFPVCCRSC